MKASPFKLLMVVSFYYLALNDLHESGKGTVLFFHRDPSLCCCCLQISSSGSLVSWRDTVYLDVNMSMHKSAFFLFHVIFSI